MDTINNQKKEITFTTTTKIYFLRGFISTAIGCCLFFLGAGNWSINRGWIYFILAAILIFFSNLIVAKHNPGLLDQRSKMRKGTKKWDKIWLFSFMIFFIYGMPFIAGYDIGRLGNQIGGFSLYIGIALFFVTMFFSTWAMSVNKFFESSVRIQYDRGHYVVKNGPYKYVRHPGYTAMIFWATGFPLTVGSPLALYAGFVLLLALALRTYLEDRTLYRELTGYAEYTQMVRYRLIPYIW
jgi:protein-S-isoprenylcysteine O-methyltransferase Ste14